MKKILYLLVIGVFILLRFYSLGTNPVQLNRDEAALAYNGMLLRETGRDEWQQRWPLTLQSFGDYKLIGYPFLLVQVFSIIGASDWSARLPSALAGLGTCIVFYFLSNRFFDDKRVAVFLTSLFALTPVFFFYSRIAFEANVGLFFLLVFILLLIRKVDHHTFFLDIIALISLGMAMLTYNTPFILFPFIAVTIPFMRGGKKIKNWIFIFSMTTLLFLGCLIAFYKLTSQKNGITIFADQTVHFEYAAYRNNFHGVSQLLLGNQYVFYTIKIVNNYLSSFSLQFLVLRGGSHPWHSLPKWSHLLLTEYIIALLGIIFACVYLLKSININKIKKLAWLNNPIIESKEGKYLILLYWLLISLVPSVITVDSPHATRSLFFFIVLLLLSGITINWLLEKYKSLVGIAIVILLPSSILFSMYAYTYFTQYPSEQKIILQTGYEEFIQNIEKENSDRSVAVVDPDGYQYILTAWYLKIPASDFFRTIRRGMPNQIGMRYGENVLQYHFIARKEDRVASEKISVEWNDGWKQYE